MRSELPEKSKVKYPDRDYIFVASEIHSWAYPDRDYIYNIAI